MKNIKSFDEFLNEELKHLPPPSDEETEEALNDLDADILLFKASEHGLLKYVKKALEKRADIDFYMHHTIVGDENDIQFNNNGDTALCVASENGHLDVVKYLVEKGADIDYSNVSENMTPLIYAVKNEHFEVLKYLVEQGADINLYNFDQDTALDCANYNFNTKTPNKERIKMIEFLEEHGALCYDDLDGKTRHSI